MIARAMPSRRLSALLAVLLVAACQTIPPVPSGGFTPAQRQVLAGNGFEEIGGQFMLGITNRVLFPFDSSELDPAKRTMLQGLGRELVAVGIRSALVEGHASAEGETRHNVALSEQRASAVRDALVAGGIDRERTRVRGMGADDPIASNADRDGRRQNRRVVIIVTPGDALAR